MSISDAKIIYMFSTKMAAIFFFEIIHFYFNNHNNVWKFQNIWINFRDVRLDVSENDKIKKW